MPCDVLRPHDNRGAPRPRAHNHAVCNPRADRRRSRWHVGGQISVCLVCKPFCRLVFLFVLIVAVCSRQRRIDREPSPFKRSRFHLDWALDRVRRTRWRRRRRLFDSTRLVAIFAVIQSAVSHLKYPGVALPFGLHFNAFTVPAVYLAIGAVAVIALLYTKFDGTMRKADVALSAEMLERVELSSKLAISFDVVAVLVMFGCVR